MKAMQPTKETKPKSMKKFVIREAETLEPISPQCYRAVVK